MSQSCDNKKGVPSCSGFSNASNDILAVKDNKNHISLWAKQPQKPEVLTLTNTDTGAGAIFTTLTINKSDLSRPQWLTHHTSSNRVHIPISYNIVDRPLKKKIYPVIIPIKM